MDFRIAETGIARGSSPGTTTEVLRVGFPIAEIRFVSAAPRAGRAACTMQRPNTPLRTGGPSASPRPRAPWYGSEPRRRHPQAEPAYLTAVLLPLRAPPSPLLAIAVAAGALAAPLALTAGRPFESIP
jgi:hypothetical protein